MIYDLLVVIPIGVSTSGTPVQKYLEQSVNSILQQRTKYKIKLVVAADNNIPLRCKEYLLKNNVEIVWYEPYTFFRKGSIWKKIYDQWQNFESKYVSFLHYDDLWNLDRVEIMLSNMEEKELDFTWSQVFQIDEQDNVLSGDVSLAKMTPYTILSNSYAFCHSSIVNKQKILQSDILQYEDKWAANYEKLFFTISHIFINTSEKINNCSFYHRVHNNSITNNFSDKSRSEIENQRKITNYSIEEETRDSQEINFVLLARKILNATNFS